MVQSSNRGSVGKWLLSLFV